MNLKFKNKKIKASGIKFEVFNKNKEVGRAFLYLISNELHNKPYGLLEDVFVDENYRHQGIGSNLIQKVIEKAQEIGCYKLIANVRFEKESTQKLYEKLGFRKHGYEFRIDF